MFSPANRWVVSRTPLGLIEEEFEWVQGQEHWSDLRWRMVFYKWCYSPFDKQLDLESDLYVDLLYLQAYNDVTNGIKYQPTDDKLAMLLIIDFLKSQHGSIVSAGELKLQNTHKYSIYCILF